MVHTPASANASHPETDDSAEVLKELLLVFPLRPPDPASAHDRAAASYYPRVRSDEPDDPLPPREFGDIMDLPQIGVNDDLGEQSTDEESSELPSPAPSSLGLRTPMDSPPAARVLSSAGTLKDDIPDICDLFIQNRAPVQSGSESDLGSKNAAISIKPRNSRAHFYRLVVSLSDGDRPAQPLRLFMDTGSGDTFGFGTRTLQIAVPPDTMDTESRVPWSPDPSYPSHNYVSDRYDPTLTNSELRDQGLVLGRIQYADHAVAHLVLMEQRTIHLTCFDWELDKMHKIPLHWHFGVTIGANQKLWTDPSDGMLGLGPSTIQHAYKKCSNLTDDPPTFLMVLRDKLKEIPPARPGEDIAMFFCLRFPPESYLDGVPEGWPIQSWMSFNTWPCAREPAWNSRKIIVCSTQPQYRQWAVYLRSIRFARVESGKRRPVNIKDLEYFNEATITFANSKKDWGLKVFLDTGCSVTYLPLQAVQSMNEHLFGNKNVLEHPPGGGTTTYQVNPNSWALQEPWKVQVVYEFEGAMGNTVLVTGPLEGFAYQRNPSSRTSSEDPVGLIRSLNPLKNIGALGQNFFQTMYISLHKATDGLDFVRMAGQWPERLVDDLKYYHVAGASSM